MAADLAGGAAAGVAVTGRHERQAVAATFRLHGASVYDLIRAMCGPAPAAAATADIFASLGADPKVLAGDDGALRSQLLAAAHKRAVDHLRGDVGRSTRLAAMSVAQAEAEAIARAGVEARELLWRLPRVERQTIVLAYFGGHTRRHIAELLHCPDETVLRHLGAGMSKLRESAIAGTASPGVDAGGGHERLQAALDADLSDLARTLFDPPANHDAWARLAALAVTAVHGCDLASIAVVDGDKVTSVAGTQAVGDLDALQTRSGEGPSLDAAAYALAVYVADLADDADWPSFGPQAAAERVRSVLAVPLATTPGAVFNLYGSHPDAVGAGPKLRAFAGRKVRGVGGG